MLYDNPVRKRLLPREKTSMKLKIREKQDEKVKKQLRRSFRKNGAFRPAEPYRCEKA